MIVNYNEIKHMDIDEIHAIRSMCMKNTEMFCVVFNNMNFRGETPLEMSNLAEAKSFSIAMLADMILLNDINTGKITEMKNRQYAHGTIELQEVPVLEIKTKTVCVNKGRR